MIYNTLRELFMTAFSPTIPQSFSSDELHGFLAKSLQLLDLRLPTAAPKIQSQNKSWDEWLAYFEAKDLKPDGPSEFAVLRMLSVRIQQGQLNTISDSSFSWESLDSTSRRNYLNIASSLYERSKFAETLSLSQRVSLPFLYLFISAVSGINLISLNSYEREISDQYIKTVLKLSADFENSQTNLENSDESELVHTFDSKVEPFTYNVKDLYWNPKAYDYLEKQGKMFDCEIPNLRQEFADKYVVFEDGRIIDSDSDEMTLLDRIAQTDFYKDRPDAIFCAFVPRSLEVNV
jgi:hypothetical protein